VARTDVLVGVRPRTRTDAHFDVCFDVRTRRVIHHGDCVEVMATFEPDSIDAIVTDPPYGLEFMGKEWDRLGREAGHDRDRGRRSHEGRLVRPVGSPQAPDRPPNAGHRNERCLTCDKWRVSSNPCVCDEPTWEYRTRREAPHAMVAMQRERWATEAYRGAPR
jgi:hypothetical protein